MTRLFLIVILVATLAQGCRNKQEEYIDFSPVVVHVQSKNIDSTDSMQVSNWLLDYKGILSPQRYNIIYSINASCSSCLLDFIHFYISFQKANIDASVYAFVDKTFKSNMEYLFEQMGISKSDAPYIIEAPNSFFQKGIPHDGIVLLSGYRPVKRLFVYENDIIVREY